MLLSRSYFPAGCVSVLSRTDFADSGPNNPKVVCGWRQALHLATSDRRIGSSRIRNRSCQHCCFSETRKGKLSVCYWNLGDEVIFLSHVYYIIMPSFLTLKASLWFCSGRRAKFGVCVYCLVECVHQLPTMCSTQWPHEWTVESREEPGFGVGQILGKFLNLLVAHFPLLLSMGDSLTFGE